jgi:tetratricopeptide (TPR) repeat protein
MAPTPSTLIEQGYQARRENRLADAGQHFLEAVRLCRGGDDRILLARALTGLGQIERDLGRLHPALEHYSEAAGLFRIGDLPLVLAHTVRHVGDILRNQRELALAAPHYEEALAIYRQRAAETPPLDLANAIRGYALLKADSGETAAAIELWQETRQLYISVGVKAGVDEAESQLARLAPA